ncbi:unnamed protein product, partial [Discosporangium mesarthrocarpum]
MLKLHGLVQRATRLSFVLSGPPPPHATTVITNPLVAAALPNSTHLLAGWALLDGWVRLYPLQEKAAHRRHHRRGGRRRGSSHQATVGGVAAGPSQAMGVARGDLSRSDSPPRPTTPMSFVTSSPMAVSSSSLANVSAGSRNGVGSGSDGLVSGQSDEHMLAHLTPLTKPLVAPNPTRTHQRQ